MKRIRLSRIDLTTDTTPPWTSNIENDTKFFKTPQDDDPPLKIQKTNPEQKTEPSIKQIASQSLDCDLELRDVICIVKLQAEILHECFMRAKERQTAEAERIRCEATEKENDKEKERENQFKQRMANARAKHMKKKTTQEQLSEFNPMDPDWSTSCGGPPQVITGPGNIYTSVFPHHLDGPDDVVVLTPTIGGDGMRPLVGPGSSRFPRY